MTNILVTGRKGQLGSEIQELVGSSLYANKYPLNRFYFTDRAELDITNRDSIQKFCFQNKIEVIINCAAYTAVDKAEEDVINADKVNHLAVKYLAEIAKENNIKLIHISTDYIFDGHNHKPYKEDDVANPLNVYGKSKLLAEEAIKTVNPKGAVIIRTSWVYSTFGNNFVKTMLKLSKERDEINVICDQVGTPTSATDLADILLHILNPEGITPKVLNDQEILNENVTIYNFSNEGVCSWYDFAKAIVEISNITCKVNSIETEEFPTPATRPLYTLLNKSKIKKTYNITIPYWRDSLKKCIEKTKPN